MMRCKEIKNYTHIHAPPLVAKEFILIRGGEMLIIVIQVGPIKIDYAFQ